MTTQELNKIASVEKTAYAHLTWYVEGVARNLRDLGEEDILRDIAPKIADIAHKNGDEYCADCGKFYAVDNLSYLGNTVSGGEVYCPENHLIGNL